MQTDTNVIDFELDVIADICAVELSHARRPTSWCAAPASPCVDSWRRRGELGWLAEQVCGI